MWASTRIFTETRTYSGQGWSKQFLRVRSISCSKLNESDVGHMWNMWIQYMFHVVGGQRPVVGSVCNVSGVSCHGVFLLVIWATMHACMHANFNRTPAVQIHTDSPKLTCILNRFCFRRIKTFYRRISPYLDWFCLCLICQNEQSLGTPHQKVRPGLFQNPNKSWHTRVASHTGRHPEWSDHLHARQAHFNLNQVRPALMHMRTRRWHHNCIC